MIEFREANINDSNIYFKWANEPFVRALSFNTQKIDYYTHENWFKSKISDPNCLMLLFFESNSPIGQIRIEKETINEAIINISISDKFRGKGYASIILKKATKYFFTKNPEFIINAYIKNENKASIKSFEKASFGFTERLLFKEFDSLKYTAVNEN